MAGLKPCATDIVTAQLKQFFSAPLRLCVLIEKERAGLWCQTRPQLLYSFFVLRFSLRVRSHRKL